MSFFPKNDDTYLSVDENSYTDVRVDAGNHRMCDSYECCQACVGRYHWNLLERSGMRARHSTSVDAPLRRIQLSIEAFNSPSYASIEIEDCALADQAMS